MATELTEVGLEARRKYMREWQKRNREKKRDLENRRWNKIGEQMVAEEKERNQRADGAQVMSRTVMDAINIFSKKLELGLCDDWTPCERLLMYELIRKWNSCGRPHRFSVSNTELVKNTGFSRPTVTKARKALMARGDIEYTPTGNPRRAGQYSLEPLFQTKQEKADGYLEGEQVTQLPTVGRQLTHYQSNSNSGAPKGAAALPEKKKKKTQPPSAPAPLGRGSRPAKSEGEPRRVINAEGRTFQIWPRDGTGRRIVKEEKGGALDEWKFEPFHSDEFIAEILSMSIDEVKSK